MARRSNKIFVVSPNERLLIKTLFRILPGASGSYEQSLFDLNDSSRKSYRGVAHELREILRETLNYLAPDVDVMAEPGFKLEGALLRPTQVQKAQYVFRKRRLSREAMSAPELAISMTEELAASMTRTAYTRGAKDAHTISSGAEVRRLKMYIDAVLAELLEIHGK